MTHPVRWAFQNTTRFITYLTHYQVFLRLILINGLDFKTKWRLKRKQMAWSVHRTGQWHFLKHLKSHIQKLFRRCKKAQFAQKNIFRKNPLVNEVGLIFSYQVMKKAWHDRFCFAVLNPAGLMVQHIMNETSETTVRNLYCIVKVHDF